MFLNNVLIEPLAENRIKIEDKQYDIGPNFQTQFTDTNLTTKPMNDEDKSTVYVILQITGFHSMRRKKGLNSARMKDALYNNPKAIAKIRNSSLPAIQNVENSFEELFDDNLEV